MSVIEKGIIDNCVLFTNGSLNIFAHPTNVDTQSRMVVYEIRNLGSQLKTMGLLVITDAMINRVSDNWKKGKRTHVSNKFNKTSAPALFRLMNTKPRE